MLCTGIVKLLLHTILKKTILVVAVVVAAVVVVVVAVEGSDVAADSVALDALDALAVAVAVVVVVAEDVVAPDSGGTEYGLFNPNFLIETLLKEKRFYCTFIVETLFFKYDKPLFFFPFDIRKNRIHKIVMMTV